MKTNGIKNTLCHQQGLTDEKNYDKIVNHLRDTFDTGITLDLEFRRQQLRNLKRMFVESESEIMKAQYQDLRRGFYLAKIADMKSVTWEIDGMLKHLDEYSVDEMLPFNIATFADKGYLRREPFGVVLIIGTWNLPFQTCCQPLVGAIAAGNCAIVKSSEVAPNCADTIAELLPKYLDEKCYQVVKGDEAVSKALLKNKFDYIFFTGSQNVGRSILHAAAPNLTPVTLELGGINPCYIDDSADFHRAAKKILWGKLFNSGQLCISPGYVMCSEKAIPDFLRSAKASLKEWYGENPQNSPDIVRIINKHHFNRLKKLLETTKGTIVLGGNVDEDDLWIEPTIVTNVDPDTDVLVQGEIFGPILPISVVSSVDEAIRIIRSKPKPLCSNVFSRDEEVIQQIIKSTASGMTGINDVIWQSYRVGLTFGGVGDSGMGSYHGKATFDTFSHKRSILAVSQDPLTERIYNLRYPPYTTFKYEFLAWVGDHFDLLNIPVRSIVANALAMLVGAAMMLAFLNFSQQ